MPDDSLDHAGQGKLQRLPHELRMELNTRLQNGQLGPTLLPWLNSLPEVRSICAEHFDGAEVSPKNLSDYRQGAYAKWLRSKQEVENIRTRAALALDLARASGSNLSDAAAQLVAGQFMEAFMAAAESGTIEAPDAKSALAIVALRKADQEARKIELKQRELDLKEADWAWRYAGKVAAAVEEKLEELRAAADSTTDVEQRQLAVARVIFGDDLLAKIEARRKEAQAA
jgi:hypothetical protein